MALQLELQTAIKAVLTASRLSQTVFRSLATSDTVFKKDASPVTVADFGSQAIVNAIVGNTFPRDSIMAEEDSQALRKNEALANSVLVLVNRFYQKEMTVQQMTDSIDQGNYPGHSRNRFWALDPIDGTKGFLRGGQYAVCLSLIVDGKVELGVMGCPNLPLGWSKPHEQQPGTMFLATRGGGSFQRSFTSEVLTRINMKAERSASETIFCESVESGHSSHSAAARIAALLNIKGDSIRMDSQCKYGIVARGDAGIYLRFPVSDTYEEKIWDHAAGALIVEEAGGVVTDIKGKALDFSTGRTLKNNKGVVVAGKDIHAEVLAAIRKTEF
ncbi:3',5'-bisphosphate nucleotidase [Obelidium mucronatum]|nr:3',5'-bisphosphate nucleotidase [Obelidium mucronatum]